MLTVITEFGMSVWIANADGSNPRQVSPEFDMVTAEWLNDDLLLIEAISGDPRSSVTSRTMNYVLDRDGTLHIYSRDVQLSVVPVAGDRWITLGNLTGMCLHDLKGHTTPILQDYSIGRGAFDVSPSGREIVFISFFDFETYRVYKATLDDDDVVDLTLIYTLDDPASVRWSPDGKYVALLGIEGALRVFDAADFSLIGEFDVGGLEDNAFIWSPHSDAIVVSRRYGEFSYTSEIVRVDVLTGAITRLTDNDTRELISDWQIIAK